MKTLGVTDNTNHKPSKQFNEKISKFKTPQNTEKLESEDELPKISPSEQEGLKHILVAVDAVPVPIRYAWEHRCFKGCGFMNNPLPPDQQF